MTKFSLLMVDDEPTVLSTLKKTFLDNVYDIHTTLSGREALELIKDVRIDAALIDLNMPGMDGLFLLKKIKKDYPHIMIIMLTGYGGVKDAVNAIKLGAMDFLEKPFWPEELRASVARLHQIWGLKEENRNLKAKVEFQFGFHQLVGNSTVMLKLKEMIVQVGLTDASTMILGETGTGKELVARAIHYHSPRSENNFVPVDCSAISETVMESELFGHVKGAFTGAHISTQGLVRSAASGTMFLDEVGELSRGIQAKLLRTIQEKEVKPVGSTNSYKVDIRIIGATNRDLVQEVVQKNFREDLFYRLNVITINVPSFRDRKEDIPLLARYFIKRFSTDVSPVKDISKEALAYLGNYDWPGNVRELENVIQRAMALGRGEIIFPEDLPENIYIPPGKPSQCIDALAEGSMAVNEKAAIQDALAKSDNNRKKAAQILGISEGTVYRKIKKYRIKG
jgi:DNA-binding NtrC family response regulator